MAHYICTGGCGGVAETPGVCQAENCPKQSQPLKECTCLDDSHNRDQDFGEEESFE